MATKLWTPSRLITTNLCMVENPLVSIKIFLELCCNALLKCPHSFWPQNIFTLKDTVGGREGVWPPNSSCLITTNLCMVKNPLVSIKITLEHRCNALLKCPHSFWPQNIFTLKDTVGGREGVWPPNSGHHLVSSQQICAWLKILLFLSKTLWITAVMH